MTSNIGEAQTSAVGLARFIEVCRVQFKTCQDSGNRNGASVGSWNRNSEVSFAPGMSAPPNGVSSNCSLSLVFGVTSGSDVADELD